MNHAQLKAFHAVARNGGFSSAARALGVTQPTLTVQVRALEDGYRVALFHRRGRRVTLTRAGEELYTIAQRYFSVEREAEEFLRAEGGLSRGRIAIAADGPFHVMPLIGAIRDELPGLEIVVSVGNSEAVVRALLDYEAEFGLLSEYRMDDRLAVLSASRHAIVLMMPAGHEWAGRTSIPISELQDRPMILREKGSATRRSFEAALAAAGIAPRIALEIGSREAVREAVAAGLGLGVVQEPELGEDARIAAAQIDGADLQATELVVCLEERRESPVIRRLAKLIGEVGR
ncbi:MAG: LysR substrate-binding domain-containing protein [Alphaproteobacteria bacterium]|nr:LysR substrate-binding domain-containing protein [Alphaproteobacteria bacterium]